MTEADRELLNEIADRARRTETKVSKVANHFGIDAGGDKPRYHENGNFIRAPSRKTSIDDVLAAVPHGQETAISVYVGNDYLFAINV